MHLGEGGAADSGRAVRFGIAHSTAPVLRDVGGKVEHACIGIPLINSNAADVSTYTDLRGYYEAALADGCETCFPRALTHTRYFAISDKPRLTSPLLEFCSEIWCARASQPPSSAAAPCRAARRGQPRGAASNYGIFIRIITGARINKIPTGLRFRLNLPSRSEI